MRLILGLATTLLITGCGSSSELSAQEKRNNFDACKIEFLKQIPVNRYENAPSIYDKQAEEGCSVLLTANKDEAEQFISPTPSLEPEKPKVTFEQVCEKIRKAAYAHNEFDTDDDSDDLYDRWYARIRSYFSEAASLMRSMDGNYDSLIADAESASTNARGVNSGRLLVTEERLYAACKISEDAVWKDFDKWLG